MASWKILIRRQNVDNYRLWELWKEPTLKLVTSGLPINSNFRLDDQEDILLASCKRTTGRDEFQRLRDTRHIGWRGGRCIPAPREDAKVLLATNPFLRSLDLKLFFHANRKLLCSHHPKRIGS